MSFVLDKLHYYFIFSWLHSSKFSRIYVSFNKISLHIDFHIKFYVLPRINIWQAI